MSEHVEAWWLGSETARAADELLRHASGPVVYRVGGDGGSTSVGTPVLMITDISRARSAAGEALAFIRLEIAATSKHDQRLQELHDEALNLFVGLHALESEQ